MFATKAENAADVAVRVNDVAVVTAAVPVSSKKRDVPADVNPLQLSFALLQVLVTVDVTKGPSRMFRVFPTASFVDVVAAPTMIL